MPELSLNILDVVQNSVTAGADLIRLVVHGDTRADTLEIRIIDNGCGMTEEQVRRVVDPFYTTRTTRKVGLGVPFFKMAAEMAGGSFSIDSTVGKGTEVTARFQLSHIDRMPLGDLPGTMMTLIGPNPDIDFCLDYRLDEAGFVMDTREMKAVLDGVSLAEPEVLEFIRNDLAEQIAACGPAV